MLFRSLGLKGDSFVTVIDEADDDTRVNLVIHIAEKPIEDGDKPFHLPQAVNIATKPKIIHQTETNGHTHAATNGANGTNGLTNGGKRKRDDEADLEAINVKKRGKVAADPTQNDDIVLVDDTADGAILIDD